MKDNYNNTIDEKIKNLQTKIDNLNERLIHLKETKKIYESLPFAEGDVAFHKKYGNILIKEIKLKPKININDIFNNSDCTELGQILKDNTYEIVYVIITKNSGMHNVDYTELSPITIATKTLYGKTNGT